jgi:hypothetical protein
LERESSSTSLLLEELEWHTTTAMVLEGVLLLAALWVIGVISIVVPLPQFFSSALDLDRY